MKRPYEENSSKKPLKYARKDSFNDRLESYDNLINKKNWQAATKILNEDPEILARFRSAPASMYLRPEEHLYPTLRILLENHASLELLGKFWIGNTKLHFALKALHRKDSQFLMTLVLSLPDTHNLFKQSYIDNIDDAELLGSVWNKNQPSTEVTLAIWNRIGELAPKPQVTAEAIAHQEQPQIVLKENIADFTKYLQNGQSKEVLSLWEKNPLMQKWYRGETVCFGINSAQIPMSTLLGLVKALFSVPCLEPIINRIYTSCFDFEKFLKGESLEKPCAYDLLNLFELMLNYTSTIFKPQDLLQNPLLQETLRSLNADRSWVYLNKILAGCQIELLERYVETIDNVQLLELAIALSIQNSSIGNAMKRVLQSRINALSQVEMPVSIVNNANSFFSIRIVNTEVTQVLIASNY